MTAAIPSPVVPEGMELLQEKSREVPFSVQVLSTGLAFDADTHANL